MVSGIGNVNKKQSSAEVACNLAMELLKQAKTLGSHLGRELHVKVGVSTGPVVAGVIGQSKFAFDAWGDTGKSFQGTSVTENFLVNVSSRMETSCDDDHVQVAHSTFTKTSEIFDFESRGPLSIKGKGVMETYYLIKRKNKEEQLPQILPNPSEETR